jgi:coproporphyrinogen III oxidase-like Fe-S oxidoreductase
MIKSPIDTSQLTIDELAEALAQVYSADPRLKPNSAMHDYQLTYPPAIQLEKPEFIHNPSHDEYVEQAIGNYKNVAFYFHFGFCQYHCRYCHHYEIRTARNEELMEWYLDSMIKEMRLFKTKAPHLKKLIYLPGGGTPTAIPTRLLKRFLEELTNTFGASSSALSTVEVKPITASTEKLEMLVKAGFSRINLGVQTLDPELYAFHHHNEKLSVALDAIDRAKACGFELINIDILTGLERQTPQSWQLTLDTINQLVADKKIDSVFIYPYHDDPRSKTFNQPEKLPTVLETAHSEVLARKLFEQLGWKELGTRFFRSPRHVRREIFEVVKIRANPSYGELLYHGFGNSSFSVGDRATYLNHRKIEDYCAQINQGKMGISHWTTLDDAQRATRDLSFDILYSPIVRVRAITKKYGEENMQSHLQNMQKWADMGLGKWNRFLGFFRLTKLGKLVHQQMLVALYLQPDQILFKEVMDERLKSGRAYRGY